MMTRLSLFFLLFSFSAISKAQNSNMVFFTEQGENFTIYLNGVQANPKPMPHVRVENMPSNIYQVRIVFENTSLGIINDKVTLMESTEKTWKIRRREGGQSATGFVVRMLSEIPIASAPPANPNQPSYTYQPGSNTFSGQSNSPAGSNPSNNPPSGQNGTNIGFNTDPNGNFSFNMNVSGNGVPNGTYTNSSGTTTTTTYNYNGYSYQTGHHGCSNPISAEQFKAERFKIKSQKTEAGRLILTKKLVNNRCLTSQQVHDAIVLLVYSNNRLDVAKLAYARCWDPDNYEVVFNAFSMSNQVEELQKHIETVNISWGFGGNNNNYNNNNQNNTPPPGNGNWSTTQSDPNRNWNNGGYVPGYTGPAGCPFPMSHSEFLSAKITIENETFENTKMTLAKQIAASHCFTTDQVIELVKLFDFENSKLDFAKYAYSHTYDKGNYYKVSNAFEFSQSKTDLMNYIKDK